MNYRELDVPCYGCSNRTLACHGKCELYADFVKKNEERREKIYEQRDIASAHIDRVKKQARRSGKYLRNVFY